MLAAFAAAGLCAGTALAATAQTPMPKPRPHLHISRKAMRDVPLPHRRPQAAGKAAAAYAQATVGMRGALLSSRAAFKPLVRPVSGPFSIATTTVTSASDIAAVKRAIQAAAKGRDAEADEAKRSITDPVARKLAEWAILRSNSTNPSFQRYVDFVNANPEWPHVSLFRRRAENALWNDNLDTATVLAYFARHKPITAKGRYMLARALLAKGDRAKAAELVRSAWRNQDCSTEVESRVIEMFGDMLTRADHKARMDKRFYARDIEAGMRAAHRLGGNELLVARAWAAVLKHRHNAKALLDAVPSAARKDAGYIFARAKWLRRQDEFEAAAKLMLSAPRDAAAILDPDQWWRERRTLMRALLDHHETRDAYRIAVEAVTPASENYRAGKYFAAGWIALRYLHDPKTAATLFAHISEGTDNPHALSRGGYWQGRAAEALGHRAQAKAFYMQAAAQSATYYGQLARAKLGISDLDLHRPPKFTPHEHKVLSNLELVRAAEILYALDERDLLTSIFASIGESSTDIAGMAMLAEVAAKHKDARAMALLGEYAHARGLPLGYYAFPTVGLPDYKPIAAPIGRAVAYSIARQESHFNQKVVSPAHAMGLMQVTPAAGKDTAKRYKVTYSRARLRDDPAYNVQMGAAELSNLLQYYDGSYLLTFAAYNAGRGRVRQWIEAYGDPRDHKVDPVDWVERLPFSETRNYVERIMENLQVYRARFGGNNKLTIEADLYRGRTN